MREVKIQIPDQKFAFFMQLFEHLGLEISEDAEIPEEHKAIVRDRMKRSADNPEILLDWDEVKDQFKLG